MNDARQQKAGWKQALAHELSEYWINFVYLALFFGAFTWYGRLTLEAYRISYLHYGVALIKALILAKVILIGDALHLGQKTEKKPLILPTLYKAVVFTVFVGIFEILEHSIEAWIRGKGLMGGITEILSSGRYELLAQSLVTFFAFIPFFAFKELERVLGEGKIRQLFFRKRACASFDLVPHAQ